MRKGGAWDNVRNMLNTQGGNLIEIDTYLVGGLFEYPGEVVEGRDFSDGLGAAMRLHELAVADLAAHLLLHAAQRVLHLGDLPLARVVVDAQHAV